MRHRYLVTVSLVIERDYFPTDAEGAEVVIATMHERTRARDFEDVLTLTECEPDEVLS